MKNINEMLQSAIKIGNNVKYIVDIDGIYEQMTYIELGTFLVSNSNNIKEIQIILKE